MAGVELVIIAGVVVLAACLHGAIGFGLGMPTAPATALVDPSLLPGSIVLLAAGVTVPGVIRDRTAIGGPPMALVWQGSSTAQLRGTMSAFFLVGALMSLAASVLGALLVLWEAL